MQCHRRQLDFCKYQLRNLIERTMQHNVTVMCQTFRETLYDMKMMSGLNWLRKGSKDELLRASLVV